MLLTEGLLLCNSNNKPNFAVVFLTVIVIFFIVVNYGSYILKFKIFLLLWKSFFLLQLCYCIKHAPNVLKIHLMQPQLYVMTLSNTCTSGISYDVDFIRYLCCWYIMWWWICQIPTTLNSQNVMLIKQMYKISILKAVLEMWW